MEASLVEHACIIFAAFFGGFVLSLFLVLPFTMLRNVKSFAASAAGEIRGA